MRYRLFITYYKNERGVSYKRVLRNSINALFLALH